MQWGFNVEGKNKVLAFILNPLKSPYRGTVWS
jgi:hypothetical protein